jgi:hypothetical protein
VLDKLVRQLQKAGKLRKQKAGFVQIEALLKEAILDLEEAQKIAHLAEKGNLFVGVQCDAESRQGPDAHAGICSR